MNNTFIFITGIILHLLPLLLYGFLIVGTVVLSSKTKTIKSKQNSDETEREYIKTNKLKSYVEFISFWVFVFNFYISFSKLTDFVNSYK